MIRRKLGKKTYLVNGFLESGKTEFIKYTLEQPYFKTRGTTLLILCEEGEVTYERSFLRRNKIVLHAIEKEEDFTVELLTELDQTIKPQRILIEYNGMWSNKNIQLPNQWLLEQQITTIDATTFGMYYMNMKSMIGEMVKNSELILFNRADGVKDLAIYKRNIKLVNQSAEIVFEGKESEISTVLEEELPYNVNDEVIQITEETYGVWFIDTLENTDRYIGKEVEFIGQVLKKDSFPKNYFVPMRKMMTCCEDDIATLGFICEYEGAEQLLDDSWVQVKATVHKEYWADYGDEGPVLHAASAIETIAPQKAVIDFT